MNFLWEQQNSFRNTDLLRSDRLLTELLRCPGKNSFPVTNSISVLSGLFIIDDFLWLIVVDVIVYLVVKEVAYTNWFWMDIIYVD